MPSFVIGRNDMVKDADGAMTGSNSFALAQILGISIPFSAAGTTVHLDDVATVHIRALDSRIPGNTHYLMVSGGIDGAAFGDVLGIVTKNYPKAVASGVLPNNGVMNTIRLKEDSSKVEKTFGFKLKDYESQIKNLIEWYLELVGEKTA
jgi:nucleoside-diphosphate-sugar epimerase